MMPVEKCPDGKWRVMGSNRCIYNTRAEAEKAYREILLKIKNRDK